MNEHLEKSHPVSGEVKWKIGFLRANFNERQGQRWRKNKVQEVGWSRSAGGRHGFWAAPASDGQLTTYLYTHLQSILFKAALPNRAKRLRNGFRYCIVPNTETSTPGAVRRPSGKQHIFTGWIGVSAHHLCSWQCVPINISFTAIVSHVSIFFIWSLTTSL